VVAFWPYGHYDYSFNPHCGHGRLAANDAQPGVGTMAVNNKVIRKFKPKTAAPPHPAAIPVASAPAAPPLPPPAREIPSAVPISLPVSRPAPAANDIESTIAAPEALLVPPIPGQKIHRLQSAIQKEKTGIILDGGSSGIAGLAAAAEKAVQSKIEEFREQMQNYLEVCDSLASDNWQPQDLIDVLHMLILSLGMDVVSMVLLDPVHPAQLAETVVSRGYGTPPSAEVLACWQGAVADDGRGIQWPRLMEIAADKGNALSQWLAREDLHSFGYVPIRDHHRIHGFLLVGAHAGKDPSPLASGILEVAGGRIGLSLAVRPGALPREVASAPQATAPAGMDEIRAAIQDLRAQLTRAAGGIGMLRDGLAGGDASPEECRDLVEQCANAIAEGTRLLRRLASGANGN